MPAIEGLVLFPGAGGVKEHATLVALERSLSPLPVLRREFSYRRAGKRVPPRAPKLVAELMQEQQLIADELGCRPDRLLYGGRSMGGRVCSMAVAAGMPAAGLVLLSYPLHPPNKPDKLRVEHFADIRVPCLFVSGNNDPFGTRDEFNQHLKQINGSVEVKHLEGGGHDPKSRAHVAAILETVNQWITSMS